MAPANAPKTPSSVFFGLTTGVMRMRPKFLPTM